MKCDQGRIQFLSPVALTKSRVHKSALKSNQYSSANLFTYTVLFNGSKHIYLAKTQVLQTEPMHLFISHAKHEQPTPKS